ncbi:MAG: peptidyl-prolyl cis-trans isomerase SurA [Gammaproteobacteria bacterium]|jgi:peptidyl-prolyl cis-trans isomerase SurA
MYYLSRLTNALYFRAARAFASVLVLAIAFAAPAATSAQALSYRGIQELDRVVAVVDEDVIVMSELIQLLATVRAEIQRSGGRMPPTRVLEQQVLDRLINERLQLQTAERIGVRVRDEELNRAVANIAERNKIGLVEFREILERDGVGFESFRERIRKEMVIARVRQRQVRNRIRVSDAEIERHLKSKALQGADAKEYQISHILIAVPEGAEDSVLEARESEARALLAEINAGTDFATVAITHSQGAKALEGGDLGWRSSDKLPSIFAGVIPTLDEGEVGGPIKSDSGFHLIKVTDVRGEAQTFISQTHPQHILVQTNELVSDADAKLRLSQLRERIIQGENFGELARSHSDDRGSAIKDGDLGWVGPGDLVPQFEKAMDALAPNDISEPFQSSFGWHIVRVTERRQHDSTRETRRAKARSEIRARRINDEMEAWMSQLRDEAYIEYRLEEQ